MNRLRIEAEGVTKGSPSQVWALVANADTYSDWGPFSASSYRDHGDPATGVGAVRLLRSSMRTMVEKVVEVDPDRHLAYTLEQGLPLPNYRGVVTLTGHGEGTAIRWEAEWDRTLAGRLIQPMLSRFFARAVASLVAAADRAALGT